MDNFLAPEGDVVSYHECERLVQELRTFKLTEYSGQSWLGQHELLTKLNLQAHINAASRGEEYVMESLATFDKVRALVHELILTDVWKREVLPSIQGEVAAVPIKSYIAVFHEAVLANLLEIVCFHKTALAALEEGVVDLIDYCYDKLSFLYVNGAKNFPTTARVTEVGGAPELQASLHKIQFSVQISCVSILRYITDHLNDLNISARSFLVVERDVATVLVGLIESRPWLLNTPDGRFVFEDNEFKPVRQGDIGKVPKVEAQIWLSIFNLLFGKESSQIFELTESRKNCLLKLKKYLNGTIVDQIPVLVQLRTFLDQISVAPLPNAPKSNPFIIAIVPQMKAGILGEADMGKVVAQQRELWKKAGASLDTDYFKRIGDLYSHQSLPQAPPAARNLCANCGKEATKRCSRCKTVWYCCKECQVTHFKAGHRGVCKSADQAPASQADLVERDQSKIEEKHEKREKFDELD